LLLPGKQSQEVGLEPGEFVPEIGRYRIGGTEPQPISGWNELDAALMEHREQCGRVQS
jgi:hypothetical protein